MDPAEKLRHHYEKQQLPPDRVRALVAAGHAVAREGQRRRGRWLLAAAALVVGLGVLGGMSHFRARSAATASGAIGATDLARAVTDFFAQPEPALGLVSPDRRALIAWLQQRGGPADFQPPPAMTGLATFGCQVLEVRGEKVYLLCFVAGPPAPGTKNAAPALVHLVLAPQNRAGPNGHTTLPAQGEWHFNTWTDGKLLILAATTLPAEHLASLVGG